MADKEIVIKGSLHQLKVYPPSEVTLPELKAFFGKKFESSGFFRGVRCRIDILDQGWNKREKEDIKKTIRAINEMIEVGFFRPEDELTPREIPELRKAPEVIKRSFRSGQKVAVLGDLIIVGDVNPGAEVLAGGDIVVFGKVVGGLVHAGAQGDEKARIFALELAPTQLRIGKILGRSPDDRVRRDTGPEVARVKKGRIIIENYSARGEGRN